MTGGGAARSWSAAVGDPVDRQRTFDSPDAAARTSRFCPLAAATVARRRRLSRLSRGRKGRFPA